MTWPILLLGVFAALGLRAPRPRDRSLLAALAVVLVVLAVVYAGLGGPPRVTTGS